MSPCAEVFTERSSAFLGSCDRAASVRSFEVTFDEMVTVEDSVTNSRHLQEGSSRSDSDDESSESYDSDSSDSDSESSSSGEKERKDEDGNKEKTSASSSSNDPPPPTKKKKPFWSSKPIVFVKGLPFSTNLQDIKKVFSSCGNVVKVDRQLDDKKRWTGSIFVRFDSQEAMEGALSMNGELWKGEGADGKRFITVQKNDQKKRSKKAEKAKKGATHSVFIGNLEADVDRQEIQDLFLECGTIKGIRLATDSTGKCRGFGYIEFDEEEGKLKAMTKNKKFKVNDKLIQVRKAQNNSSNQKPRKKNTSTKPSGAGKKKRDTSKDGNDRGSKIKKIQ